MSPVRFDESESMPENIKCITHTIKKSSSKRVAPLMNMKDNILFSDGKFIDLVVACTIDNSTDSSASSEDIGENDQDLLYNTQRDGPKKISFGCAVYCTVIIYIAIIVSILSAALWYNRDSALGTDSTGGKITSISTSPITLAPTSAFPTIAPLLSDVLMSPFVQYPSYSPEYATTSAPFLIQSFIDYNSPTATTHSFNPSSNPSIKLVPTSFPTFFPTRTQHPNFQPTQFPTANLSLHPSSFLTSTPSDSISSKPSTQPSALLASISYALTSTPSINNSPSNTPSAYAELYNLIQPPILGNSTINDVVQFYTMGDAPYNPYDAILLQRDLEKLVAQNNVNGNQMFLIHLGDLQSVNLTSCKESAYSSARKILSQSPVPTFVLAGDNDYNDCPEPNKAWEVFLSNFERFHRLWDHTLLVNHMPQRPENFSFYHNGVLFISVNLVGGLYEPIEWSSRHADNVRWTEANINFYGNVSRAMIVFGHATPTKRHEDYFVPLMNIAKTFQKPLLYMHGDGHKWRVTKKFNGEMKYQKVMVDQGLKAPPVKVTVRLETHKNFEKAPFVFNRRLDMRPSKRPTAAPIKADNASE